MNSVSAVPMSVISMSINNGGVATETSRYILAIQSSNKISMSARAGDGIAEQSYITTTATLNASTWYHLYGLVNISTDSWYIYVNGISQALTLNAGTGTFTPTVTDNTTTTSNRLGASDTGVSQYLNGKLADLRLYNCALSQQEIDCIYACKGHDSVKYGLVNRWIMNEGVDGTTVTGTILDLNNSVNGTPVSSPVFSDAPLSMRRRMV
jgi:hypothetical protein